MLIQWLVYKATAVRKALAHGGPPPQLSPELESWKQKDRFDRCRKLLEILTIFFSMVVQPFVHQILSFAVCVTLLIPVPQHLSSVLSDNDALIS